MNTLLAGWAETDITPDGIIDLYGQYYHRLSEGVHSRLAATVLALESKGGEQAVLVSLDLLMFEAPFLSDLRTMLRTALPELDVGKVMLSVIHTHNAPGVDPICGIDWLKELPQALPVTTYRAFVLEKVRDAILLAWKNRKPAATARALGAARVGHCRRAVYAGGTAEMYGETGREDFIGMEGGEDSGVDMLFLLDESRKPTGMILNLACPSQMMEATYKISSDFLGETRRLLQAKYGKDFRLLSQISAAGCQSPRDLTRNYHDEAEFWNEKGVAEIGQRLLHAVSGAFPSGDTEIDEEPLLQHNTTTLNLPIRRASYQAYTEAKQTLARLEAHMSEAEAYKSFCEEVLRNEKIPGRPGPFDSKLHHFVLIQNNKAVIARYESQDAKPTLKAEAHFLRLGEVAFATNPFELYLTFGQQIKARSKAKQTFVVQLCCGASGYLPSAYAEKLGGYGGLIINGTVGSEGGQKLVDESVAEIASLFTVK